MHQNYLLFALKAKVGAFNARRICGNNRSEKDGICMRKKKSAHGQYALWVSDLEGYLSQILYLNKLITIKGVSKYWELSWNLLFLYLFLSSTLNTVWAKKCRHSTDLESIGHVYSMNFFFIEEHLMHVLLLVQLDWLQPHDTTRVCMRSDYWDHNKNDRGERKRHPL